MSPADDKTLARIFKALGDETRLQIVRMLAGKERCVCAFLGAFPMSQPSISNHLRVLREAGVLTDKKEGRWVFYRIHPEAVLAVEAFCKLAALPENGVERVDPAKEICFRPLTEESCCEEDQYEEN